MPNDTPTTTLLTRSAYARHRGVTPAQITHWSKQGRIVFVNDQVAVEATDKLLAAVLDPSRGGPGGGAPNRAKPAETDDESVAETAKARGRPPDAAGVSYTRVATRHREIQAQRAELDLRARQGELTEVAAVARGNDAAFGQVRDMLDNLPARLASRLAAENDVRKCHALIEAECRAALNALADTLTLHATARAAAKQ